MLFSWVDRRGSPGVLMMGTSNLPNSLSGKWVDSFPSESSYSSILAFPLSYFGLGCDVLWSLGGSCGPLNLVEIGLSSDVGLGRSSSSASVSNSVSTMSDGTDSTIYHNVDSSNTTSLLTHTFLVEGLKHVYPFCSSEYPIRIHFSNLGSSFCRFSLGICMNAIEPNILTWDKFGFFPWSFSWGVESCTSDVVHRFIRYTVVFAAST